MLGKDIPPCRLLLALLLLLSLPAAARAEVPVVVGLVMDTSGSLTPGDLDRARRLAGELYQALPAGSEVAVFAFDDESRLEQGRTSELAQVNAALSRLKRQGRYSALHDALYDVSRYLRDAPGTRAAIVLLTDGRNENSAVELEDGLRIAVDSGIPVYGIGVGKVEEKALRRIAKLTGGDFLRAERANGAAIAKSIAKTSVTRKGPAPAATEPAPVAAAPAQAPPATTALPAPPATAAAKPPSPAPAAKPSGLDRRLVAAAAAILAALVGLATVVYALRRRQQPDEGSTCPTCGDPLSSPLAKCPRCSTAVMPALRAPRPAEPPPDAGTLRGTVDELSQTVIEGLNHTEEYLEKTITMREKPVLVVTRGNANGKVYDLGTEATTSLGRSKANDIVVQDVAVSGQHCRIRPEDGAFVLFDLNSTNGTFVNERPVTRHQLVEGDIIRIGDTCLQFRREQRLV